MLPVRMRPPRRQTKFRWQRRPTAQPTRARSFISLPEFVDPPAAAAHGRRQLLPLLLIDPPTCGELAGIVRVFHGMELAVQSVMADDLPAQDHDVGNRGDFTVPWNMRNRRGDVVSLVLAHPPLPGESCGARFGGRCWYRTR